MSFTHASNSAMPTLVGGAAMVTGAISLASLAFDGPPVINTAGGQIADFSASLLTVIGGYHINKSRLPIAGWLGAGVAGLALAYAVNINLQQAGRMLDAAQAAAKSGANAASKDVASNSSNNTRLNNSAPTDLSAPAHAKYVPLRLLTEAEAKGCTYNLSWVRTEDGQRNCKPDQNGNRFLWITAKEWDSSTYQSERKLTADEIAECDAGTAAWTKTMLGKFNCHVAKDGNRYKWKRIK